MKEPIMSPRYTLTREHYSYFSESTMQMLESCIEQQHEAKQKMPGCVMVFDHDNESISIVPIIEDPAEAILGDKFTVRDWNEECEDYILDYAGFPLDPDSYPDQSTYGFVSRVVQELMLPSTYDFVRRNILLEDAIHLLHGDIIEQRATSMGLLTFFVSIEDGEVSGPGPILITQPDREFLHKLVEGISASLTKIH